ncbi:aromatase/cyclase [Streptomyces sp. NPDC102402]|uniref:aromatase/cyclase n=1 Tax=Streptomyces sp. NPDC102402 TaxID=3366169 RepID=UPI0038155C50
MPDERVRRTSYTVDVAAPAGVLYGLIADTTRWPLLVPPAVHVERLDFDGIHDRFRMWVTANGSVTSWISRRHLDAANRTIDFHQEVAAAPAANMGGRWVVEDLGGDRSRITLSHCFTVVGDDLAGTEWLTRATSENSRAQLARLKETAELWTRLDELQLTVEESVRVQGPAELVYQFLYDVQDWPEHLAHVVRADVREDRPGIQVVTMDTRTPGAPARTTESVRVCFPHAGHIAFKETLASPLLAAHRGEWSVTPDENGVTAAVTHSVLLREEAVESVLGRGADLAQARRYVRDTLGAAGAATLRLARRHAESAVRTLCPGQ